ncbi:hypothetical protein ANN_11759 [Periplaneta americana]|uniref:Transmembrane protein n=1 Tax=Periplaneta americana TaxID=6978 RepID=A0ABQ8T5Y5_PERAM|nr:hypothetical protein ANN_11759 [Periplaneta americana]
MLGENPQTIMANTGILLEASKEIGLEVMKQHISTSSRSSSSKVVAAEIVVVVVVVVVVGEVIVVIVEVKVIVIVITGAGSLVVVGLIAAELVLLNRIAKQAEFSLGVPVIVLLVAAVFVLVATVAVLIAAAVGVAAVSDWNTLRASTNSTHSTLSLSFDSDRLMQMKAYGTHVAFSLLFDSDRLRPCGLDASICINLSESNGWLRVGSNRIIRTSAEKGSTYRDDDEDDDNNNT